MSGKAGHEKDGTTHDSWHFQEIKIEAMRLPSVHTMRERRVQKRAIDRVFFVHGGVMPFRLSMAEFIRYISQ